ncbi:unnamed protein product [Rhodiola kirilowii]
MAGLEAPTAALFSAFSFKSYRHSSLSKLHYQAFSGLFTRQTSPFPLRLLSAASSPVTSQLTVQTLSAEHDVSVGDLEVVNPAETNQKRKLYVVNLPPFISGPFVTKMFRQCGVVKEVEIIKEKDGRSRGYAFVTMATSAQAQSVIERFNNKTVAGRTIRIQYAKQFKKPAPSRNLNIPPASETRFKLYVSNLGFKVRANHLRECFAAVSSPVSARVVFDGPLGRSIGYGFVSYAKKEEAEAALTALNGQELMGRPLCIQFSEKNAEERPGDNEEDTAGEQQPVDASDSETDISKFLLDRNILLTDIAD